jgi:hypothetical protein
MHRPLRLAWTINRTKTNWVASATTSKDLQGGTCGGLLTLRQK